MAVKHKPFVIAKNGRTFVSPLGTEVPDVDTMNLNVAPEGWEIFSDYKIDAPWALTKEGGEKTIIATWWDPNSDSDSTAVQWGATATGVEMNVDLLDAYFGGDWNFELDRYEVPKTAVPVIRQVLTVFFDAKNRRVGHLVENCEISGGEAPTSPVDSHAGLPLKFNFMSGITSDSPFSWLGKMMRPRDAAATATILMGSIESIEVTDGGQRYKTAPTVVIEGDGTGAAATAVINESGAVTAVVVETAGMDYTTATVKFTRVAAA